MQMLNFKHYGVVGTSLWERSYKVPEPVDTGEWMQVAAARPTPEHVLGGGGEWVLPEIAEIAPEPVMHDLSMEQADMLCAAANVEDVKSFLMEVLG